MSAQKKWVYWHRVIWADNDSEEGSELKLGSLLGLTGKTPSCARMVTDEVKRSIELKDYVKLQFLGRMLRTATAEEVAAAFPNPLSTIKGKP